MHASKSKNATFKLGCRSISAALHTPGLGLRPHHGDSAQLPHTRWISHTHQCAFSFQAASQHPSFICLQATSVANLLKDEVAEGHRQLVALATAAASAQGAHEATPPLTVQELETRQDPTVEISSMLRQSRCANHSTLHTKHTNSLPYHFRTPHHHHLG